MPRDQFPSEVQKILDAALANTQPRKHHLVPSSYLRRWEVEGRLRVHGLEEGTTYVTKAVNAARETDYYRVDSEDLDSSTVPPMIFETILTHIEGPAVKAIDELAGIPERVDPQVRYDVANFMAFQYTRGHRVRLRIRATANEIAKLQFRDLTDDDIRGIVANQNPATQEDVDQARDAIRQLQEGDIVVRPQDAQVVALAFGSALTLARLLFERSWLVLETYNNLITTDEPVLPIGGPGSPRTESSGIATAGLVAFPLGPSRILLTVRKDLADALAMPADSRWLGTGKLEFGDTVELSKELVISATRWAFERPDRNLINNLQIPPRPSDVYIDEAVNETGDRALIRHYGHTRWTNAALIPPWPLPRFWPRGWKALPLPPVMGDEIDRYRREQEREEFVGQV